MEQDFDLDAHDPALAEQLKLGKAGEEIALVVDLTEQDSLPECARLISRFGDIGTIRVKREQLAALLASAAVRSAEAPRAIRSTDELIEPDYLYDEGADLVELAHSHRAPGLRATGTGTCVGCLDWGLDFAHPDFRNEDGSTRLLSLWDQRSSAWDSQHPNRFGYGRIYTQDEIDAALREADPYEALGYNPGDSDRKRRGKWQGTHGTHVLSIAAGNGRAGGPQGVAPNADLVFVHLSGTTPVRGKGSLGDSVTILEAIDAVFEAAEGKSCAINMSVGAHGGPHDGTTHVERAIDRAVTERPGRAIVNSAGNYRQRRTHVQGRLDQGERRSVGVQVPEQDSTRNEIEFYYKAADKMRFDVFGPNGELVIALEQNFNAPLELNGEIVGHIYHYRHHGTSGTKDRHVDMFLNSDAPAGDWRIEVVGEQIVDGRFDGWIERDSGPSPVFTGPDVTERTTTGTLCNGMHSITTGALNRLGAGADAASFSSSGPTRDGRMKPEIVAPGVRIVGAKSTPPEGPVDEYRYTALSGTSMAAPRVAGTVALMFEAAGEPIDITDLRAALLSSVRREGEVANPRPTKLHLFGHGVLDMLAAEKTARILGEDHRARNAREQNEASQPDTDTDADTDNEAGGAEQKRLEYEDEVMFDQAPLTEKSDNCTCESTGNDWEGSLVGESAPAELEFATWEPDSETLGEPAPAQSMMDGAPGSQWLSDPHAFDLPQPEFPIQPPFVEEPSLPTEEANENYTVPSGVSDWADLIRFLPSRSMQSTLRRRGFRVQHIGSATSTDVNLDYYPVYVRQMPMLHGRRLTAPELFAHFRRNINDFIDTGYSEFEPFRRPDHARWSSSSPLGSIIFIDIRYFDNAYVVCSQSSSRHWRFSTLTRTDLMPDDEHPVSGTREFGYEGTNSHAVFYTKGADRATYSLEFFNRKAFAGGHDLWVSFQREFVNWVNRHGGRAMRFMVGSTGRYNISNRHNWARVMRTI
ncbi:MAG: S8 family peptidase [Pseudomonadota bacterium]